MDEQIEREMVIAEAKSWIGTPYHDKGRVKGVGCDCLTFLAGVFENTGLIQRIDIPHYSAHWHIHQKKELYLEGLLKYTKEIPEPKPGSIVVWRFANTFSHGGIVTEWPFIIHSLIDEGVTGLDVRTSHGMNIVTEKNRWHGQKREVKFFDFWEKNR